MKKSMRNVVVDNPGAWSTRDCSIVNFMAHPEHSDEEQVQPAASDALEGSKDDESKSDQDPSGRRLRWESKEESECC